MVVMLAIGVSMRFVQEHRAGLATKTLRRLSGIHASVLRDVDWHDLRLDGLVSGDVEHMAAGDLVPADGRLIARRDLFIAQGVLTGEWSGGGGCDAGRCSGAALSRTGWVVESLATQTLVIHVIRTQRLPWRESRASRSLSAAYWPILIVTVMAYLAVTHAAMRLLVRRGWIA
jgi:magnesium-transporting ATPase (P-type)